MVNWKRAEPDLGGGGGQGAMAPGGTFRIFFVETERKEKK